MIASPDVLIWRPSRNGPVIFSIMGMQLRQIWMAQPTGTDISDFIVVREPIHFGTNVRFISLHLSCSSRRTVASMFIAISEMTCRLGDRSDHGHMVVSRHLLGLSLFGYGAPSRDVLSSKQAKQLFAADCPCNTAPFKIRFGISLSKVKLAEGPRI